MFPSPRFLDSTPRMRKSSPSALAHPTYKRGDGVREWESLVFVSSVSGGRYLRRFAGGDACTWHFWWRVGLEFARPQLWGPSRSPAD